MKLPSLQKRLSVFSSPIATKKTKYTVTGKEFEIDVETPEDNRGRDELLDSLKTRSSRIRNKYSHMLNSEY